MVEEMGPKKGHHQCHGLKEDINKPSDRRSLLNPTLPPEEGRRRKRERDLQTEYRKFY